MDDGTDSPHKVEAQKRLSAMGRRYFHLIEFDDNEELYAEIRKHWFGLFLVYLTGIFITVVIGLATIIVPLTILEGLLGTDISAALPIIVSVGFILTVLALGGMIVAGILYESNVIYVTSEKIAQVQYTSLFSRKISQLSIGDIQDVTVSQNGVFPRIFNYGTLVIETAGEQQNYTFSYVPKPYENSKSVIGAHETNLRQFGN